MACHRKMGHPQQPILVHVSNTMLVGMVDNCIKWQQWHAMEMHYFWPLDDEPKNSSNLDTIQVKKTLLTTSANKQCGQPQACPTTLCAHN